MKTTAALLILGFSAVPLPSAPTTAATRLPAIVPTPSPVPTAHLSGLYSPPARPDGHWTWPGDLREHLRQTHGIDASRLSDAEAMALHDADHLRRPYLGRTHSGHPARPVTRTGKPTYAASHARR